jgi:hypothetical protein
VIDQVSQERLFFHDLINHTHGLTLFLEQRISSGEQLSNPEMQLLYQEISLLQMMIIDYFKYEHQNIDNNAQATLEKLHPLIVGLMKKYLSQCDLKVENEFEWNSDYVLNHLASYRIFTNLIKNIADACPQRVSIKFSLQYSLLICSLENDFNNIKKHQIKGIGLQSIEELVRTIGGKIQWSIDQHTQRWHTEIRLPLELINKQRIAA